MAQEEFYQKLHETNSAYQHNNQGIALFDIAVEVMPMKPKVLEVGCGNGKLCEMLAADYCVTGIDIIRGVYPRNGYSYVKHDITKAWPFEDKQFDYVLCFDVLEHLPEADISYTVSQMESKGRNALVSIAHYGSPKIHLTIKPYEWWVEKLKNWHLVRLIDRYGNEDCKVSIFRFTTN
jgi:2-polyprenyl-3-methyl-5-hydroxy-6-metoxy-1,4-benzoquinol methylase